MFEEEQRIGGKLMPAVGVIAALIITVALWQVYRTSPHPAVLWIMGIDAVLFLWVFSRLLLRTWITADGIRLRIIMGPFFWTKDIPRGDIRGAEAFQYRAMQSGGYGMRWTKDGWYWNAWGHDAIRVTLADGQKIMIGTQQPGSLRSAIASIAGLR